jgi:hypothetical protein
MLIVCTPFGLRWGRSETKQKVKIALGYFRNIIRLAGAYRRDGEFQTLEAEVSLANLRHFRFVNGTRQRIHGFSYATCRCQ